MKNFTFSQINNWRSYEEVRESGEFNMWAPQAQAAAGLSTADYLFCIENFAELQKQANEEDSV